MSSTETLTPATAHPHGEQMSHRQILEALSGLLLGMFVAILSSTVVSNALPVIVSDLKGNQSGYTWVIVATLLATTISTPIWGKLADLFSKKILVQTALVIFVAASAVAGLSHSMAMLITTRVFQGLGAGGLTALAQTIMATMIAPRQRGRYSGYLGATFALATVAGPLIGGVLTQHLSWRWCFYVGIPFAVLAFFVLQWTLHLPVLRRNVQIDYLGAVLIASGVASLLVWVSLAGQNFAWWSWQTWLMVGGGIALLGLAVLAEHQAPEPIIPLRFFRSSTITLSSLASIFVGVAMFGATVFLGQYFQLARGRTPTMSGVMTIPLIGGLFLATTISGQFITRTGRWKAWVLTGGVLLTAGLGLMATIEYDTNYWLLAPYMFMIGAGVGMMMQNLVLSVQNLVAPEDLGAASSLVAFARSLGGAVGVSALGAVLSHRLIHYLEDALRAAGIKKLPFGSATGIPDLSALPGPIRTIVQSSYGSAIADVFLVAAPFAGISLLLGLFLKEVKLRGRSGMAQAGDTNGEDEITTEQHWNDAADHAPRVQDQHASGNGLVEPTARRAAVESVHSPAEAESAPLAAVSVAAPNLLTVSGAVRQSASRPLAGAQVTLTDQSGRQVARTVSNEDGSYVLPLESGGTYLLIVASNHLSPAATLVAVADNPVRRDITLTGRSTITGRVLAADGTAGSGGGIPGALVTLTDVTGQVVGSARSGEDGAYSFEQLSAGDYVLTAQSGRHRPLARGIEVPESGALACDLLLTGGGRLTGTVLAASDGRPVREATVTLVDADGQVVGVTTTADDGDYLFADLGAGRYTLTAAGYAPVALEVGVEEDAVSTAHVRLGGTATPDFADLGEYR